MDRQAVRRPHCIKGSHTQQHPNRHRQGATHMPCNRLEQEWDRLLADAKTLQVPVVRPILLPGGMASDPSGVPIHPRGRIAVRTSGGRGTGGDRCPRQGTALCPWVQRSSHSSGSQATTQAIRQSLPRGHPESSPQESEGANTTLPIQDGLHPGQTQPDQRCPVSPSIRAEITG